MTKRTQAKAQDFDIKLWLDKAGGADASEYSMPRLDEEAAETPTTLLELIALKIRSAIPHADGATEGSQTEDSQYPEAAEWVKEAQDSIPSFSELQTRSWIYYLKRIYAEKNHETLIERDIDGIEDKDVIGWINELLAESSADAPSIRRLNEKSYISSRTLDLVESVIPGSARIYFWGPDFSCLWSVLAGKDDGAALARLIDITGLSMAHIAESDESLLDILPDISEPIALHALSAMISALYKTHPQLRKTSPFGLFSLLHEVQTSLEVARSSPESLQSLDPIAPFLAQTLLAAEDFIILSNDPWYKRVRECWSHDATISRLGYYGLSLSDLVFVTGKPSEPPTMKNPIRYLFDSTLLRGWQAMGRGSTTIISLGDAALDWLKESKPK